MEIPVHHGHVMLNTMGSKDLWNRILNYLYKFTRNILIGWKIGETKGQ